MFARAALLAEMQHVVPRAEPPKRTVLLRRTVIARVGFGALCLLIVAGSYAFVTGWEVAVLRSSAAAAQREALASAHASAVHLVSRTLALQSALDAQEDHDRAMLQTYLKLERERLPALAKAVERARRQPGGRARRGDARRHALPA